MKLQSSLLLIGATAATATSPLQHVLQGEPLKQPLRETSQQVIDTLHGLPDVIKESLDSMGAEARAAWEEVATAFPEALKGPLYPPPKSFKRKPDSHWDHIIKGADVQSVWVENANGEKEREVDGKLEQYNLRAKKVDPSVLGVDPDVKQYSGYLDDDEDDKHLFYCKKC